MDMPLLLHQITAEGYSSLQEKRYTVSFNTIRRADGANLMKIRDYRIEPHESTES